MGAAQATRDLHTHHALVFRRAAILIALCVALAAAASSDALHEALLGVLGATREIIAAHEVLGLVTFVVLAAISAMFAFVSIAIIVPAAVVTWGTPVSIGLLWLGWILGGMVTYSIGKFLGRRVVRWLTADEALHKLESYLPVNAPLWLIVVLQLALPSEVPGYVLGLVRFPFTRYAVALGLAELPYTLATVYLGSSFLEGRSGMILIIGSLLALGSVATFSALQRFISGRRPGFQPEGD
ncbi:MAG TPA: VTT domain-containing protein [Steroidobacteraceae bacterium]|nr:VTT domain-containing protein [Steroidobacteraceae bacterium]